MPLHSPIMAPDGTVVHLWRADEDAAALVALCQGQGIDDTCQGHEKRRREVLAERLMLRHIFGPGVELRHRSNGAPVVEGWHVSISHSGQWVAIAVNGGHPVGLDVEQTGPRVLRVREKFLSPEEQQIVPDGDIEANLLAWTAKEALYKLTAGAAGESLSDDYGVGECSTLDDRWMLRRAWARGIEAGLAAMSTHLPQAILTLSTEIKHINPDI